MKAQDACMSDPEWHSHCTCIQLPCSTARSTAHPEALEAYILSVLEDHACGSTRSALDEVWLLQPMIDYVSTEVSIKTLHSSREFCWRLYVAQKGSLDI